jgi:hypothetical protein
VDVLSRSPLLWDKLERIHVRALVNRISTLLAHDTFDTSVSMGFGQVHHSDQPGPEMTFKAHEGRCGLGFLNPFKHLNTI